MNFDAIRPALAGPAIVRGRSLSVQAPQAELSVRAPARFVQALARWCDGRRTVSQLDELAVQHWGTTTFPAFVRSMLRARVLVDAPAALFSSAASARGSSAEARAADAFFGAGSCASGEDVQLLIEHLQSQELGIGADAASRALLRYTAILPQAAGALAAGIYRSAADTRGGGAATLQRVADAGPGAYRGLRNPLVLAGTSALLVITVRAPCTSCIASLPSPRSVWLAVGAIAAAAAHWAAARQIAWLGDVPCHESQLLRVCGLDDEVLVYAAALGWHARPGCESWPRISWVEAPQHGELLIAKAVPRAGAAAGVVAWGRSRNAATALVKALGEYAERMALQGPGSPAVAAFTDLPGAISPEKFARYSRTQIANPALRIVEFDEAGLQRWVKGSELGSGRPVWLPADCVLGRNTMKAARCEPALARPTSSGCASHTDLAKAIEAAAYEVIERDALMRHWLKQGACRCIDLDSLAPSLRERASALEAMGCSTFVLLTSEGLGPTIAVLIRNQVRGFACVGSAAGSDPESCVDVAFTEAEFAAITRAAARLRESLQPKQALTPENHGRLYAMKRYFQRADVLIGSTRTRLADVAWPASLESRLQPSGDVRAYWIELTDSHAPCQIDGRPIRTVRVLIAGCVPLAFGYGAIPEGMVAHRVPAAARFPHPLS